MAQPKHRIVYLVDIDTNKKEKHDPDDGNDYMVLLL